MEFLQAAVFLVGGAFLALSPMTFFPLLPELARVTAVAFLALGGWRLWQGWLVCRYQKHLRQLPRYTLDANAIPLSRHKLFLGRGFPWDQQYLKQSVLYRIARLMEIRLEHSDR